MTRPRAVVLVCLANMASAPLPAIAQTRATTVDRQSLSRGVLTAWEAGRVHVVDTATHSALPPTATRVQLQPGQFLAARVADRPAVERRQLAGMVGGSQTREVLVLPFRYEGAAQDARRIVLRPVVIKDSPLRYDSTGRRFGGSLLIALEDSNAPRDRKALSGPVRINFTVQADSVAPSELDLSYTNRPLSRVLVYGASPLDSVRVQVVPEFDLRGTEVWLPVQPALVIPRIRRSLAGLGIQTTKIPISIRGVTIRDTMRISVSTDRGTLESNEVLIGPGGNGIVRLRSEGIGLATISATGPGISATSAEITYKWPSIFLGAAIVGGGIGGLTNHVRKKRRSKYVRHTVTGVLVGFVVAIAYFAVGVNLLGLDISIPYGDEGAVFGLALLGGLLGIRTSDKQPA